MGSRLTVFPRAAWATFRGLGRDADVVLEVVNGISFFTSFWRWLRKPRVLLVFHVHQEHYVTELGLVGRAAALVLEHVPLRFLYPGVPVVTISQSSREALVGLGLPRERVHVVYLGLDPGELRPRERTPAPTPRLPGPAQAVQAHRPAARRRGRGPGRDAARRRRRRAPRRARGPRAELGLDGRVVFHGHVDEAREGSAPRRVVARLDRVLGRGLVPDRHGGRARARRRPRRCASAGSRRRSSTGRPACSSTPRTSSSTQVRDLVETPERLAAMGDAARSRARGFTWDNTASGTLEVMTRTIEAERPRLRDALRRSESGKAAGLAAATLLNNAIQLRVHGGLHAPARRERLRDARGAHLGLPDPARRGPVACRSPPRARPRSTASGTRRRVRATLRAWSQRLLIALVVLTVLSVLARDQIAAAIGIDEAPWGAAAILPTGALWMLISLQRGALQGLRAYAPVGTSIVARGPRPPGLRAAPVRGRAGRDRRAARHADGVRARRGRPRGRAAPAARAAGRHRRVGPVAARPARRRLGADRRPAAAGRAAEHGRDRGQAPAGRRRRGLLRGRRGGGEVGRVGRDRDRPAPAARGDAPRGRGARPAAGAAARARDPRRDRRARAADLRRRARPASAARLRAGPDARRGRADLPRRRR